MTTRQTTEDVDCDEFEGLIFDKSNKPSGSQGNQLRNGKKNKAFLRTLIVLGAIFLMYHKIVQNGLRNESSTLEQGKSTSSSPQENVSHSQEIMDKLREKYSNGNFDTEEKDPTQTNIKSESINSQPPNPAPNPSEGKKGGSSSSSHSDEIMAKMREKYNNGELDTKEAISSTTSAVTPSTPESKVVEEKKTEEPKSEVKAAEKEPITKEGLIEKWGKWHFWDGEEDIRPKEDYCAKYPNRDVPEKDLPETAWQGDAVYVNHFLDSALELLERAKEAIYTAYGHAKPLDVDGLVLRSQMFKLHFADLSKDNAPPAEAEASGGWTTEQSFQNIQKRLLHAVFTNDKFTIALGGDAVAAGHGNHFLQSYLMQLYRIMDPIFKRLNVELVVRNLANEDPGALQSALGFQSIYGDDIDMIIWDGESEKRPEVIDLFYRQALVSGKRAPVLCGDNFTVLKDLHQKVGADVLSFGSGMSGVPLTVDAKSAEKLPWAAQYLNCDPKQKALCEDPTNKFQNTCWIERNDVKPTTKQAATIENKNNNNLGFKSHLLKSRVMAFVILELLENALSAWLTETINSGHPLTDSLWHIADYYQNISKKTAELKTGPCSGVKTHLPERVCWTPMQTRTEFTPRFDIEKTSLMAIIKPDTKGNIPKLEEQNLYDGPDVTNPALEIPDGETNVLAIVSNRRLGIINPWIGYKNKQDQTSVNLSKRMVQDTLYLRKRNLAAITPGSGWKLQGSLPGTCDGTFTSECGRLKSSNCLLSGHVDSKGGIQGSESNDWLVMRLDNVKEGLVLIKLVPMETSNNDFEFEYAIDGKVSLWKHQDFRSDIKIPEDQRNLYILLDDNDMSKSGASKEMEVAIRLKNTAKATFMLTHIYWA